MLLHIAVIMYSRAIEVPVTALTMFLGCFSTCDGKITFGVFM